MKNKSLILYLIITILNSCSTDLNVLDESFKSSNGEMTNRQDPYVLYFNEHAGKASIEIESKKDIVLSFEGSRPNWCSYSVEKKDKKAFILNVFVIENESTDERNAKLTVTNAKQAHSINVVQKFKDALLVSTNRISVLCEGEAVQITTRSNNDIHYNIITGEGWINPISTKQLEENKYSFNIEPNLQENSREGKIIFSSTSGKLEETVTITQDKYSYAILTIDSETDTLRSPIFHGEQIKGSTKWGDGVTETYDSTAVHVFNNNDTRKNTFSSYRANSVTIPSMGGIKHIDLTGFCK